MYIKSIVIDGFKSYAQHTEINGFDPLFNAITGLNGSGKSNILDSICFVLGISNLSHVRATNLQDLVYKSGQAGITKATVSITFDNSDKAQSPVGYKDYDEITVTRQVVIGGRNKYMINGTTANNTRVQDLFRSVQLNVNNPHFLIMQGRITKVLNMKPPEILSMIEEAAGTRLYETKREAAQKTIEKKDAKLKEIDTILKEDIMMTLNKLKEERSSYLEYQKIIRELEHLNKLHVAYQFVCAEERKSRSAEELLQMEENVKALRNRRKEIEQQLEELNDQIAKMEEERDKSAGDSLKKLEQDLEDCQKNHTKMQSVLDTKKEALKAEQKKKKEITKHMTDDEAALKSRQKEMEKLQAEATRLKEQSAKDAEAHAAAQKHFHAVSAGLSSNTDGEDASLNDQLMAAKSDISKAETETKQAQTILKHHQQEIKKKQAELKKTEQGYKKDQAAQDNVRQAMQKMEAEMKKLGYEEDRAEKLTSDRRTLTQEVQALREKQETMEARFPQLSFEYRDPEKNFDRSRVKGLVCKLVKVKDTVYSTALEVAAGSKLYNVVVDTEVTGKKILERGELKRRYTFIPINKITSRPIEADVVKRAEGLVGKPNVHTALSLIEYDPVTKPAMEFVFGSSFVCPNMDVAKKVTFDERVMKKSVTLDGDSFDPAGMLTGGARASTSSILAKLQELKEVYDLLDEKERQLAAVEKELESLRKVADKYTQLKQQYDLKAQELQLVTMRMEQSSHHQQLEEINKMQAAIDEQEAVLKAAQETQTKASKKVKELEDKMKNAKALREKELKAAEKEVKDSKTRMEESSKKSKEKLQTMDSLRLEAEELQKETANYEAQLKAAEESMAGFEEEIKKVQEDMKVTKTSVEEAQDKLNAQREVLKACDKQLGEMAAKLREHQKESNSHEVTLQELELKISKHQGASRDAARQVEHMLDRYDWIAEERRYFGKPNTAYDFQANDPREAERRIAKLTATKDKLSKSVNMRAMNMLGKVEEQYNDLIKKRKIVLQDKQKIALVIQELDEKKNQALQQAWEKVNKDFGGIFSSLLPGTQAKLSPPEGQTVLDGLEVRVAFGDVWKESLTELSGGQRSLVALSLILAMLLFKPAPIYILDEVDAALDLSHTQNIGQMIKMHFGKSQFIVVSLKDGMFNNANVLFKTKFVDGVSTVTRHAQPQRPLTDKENEGTARKKAAASASTSAKRARALNAS